MDSLCGICLVNKCGDLIAADEALGDVDVICFYFSAHWCPPCRIFTPTLADFYVELKERNERVEIVFVSSDYNPQDMMSYMREDHGDWLAIPYGHDLLQDLRIKYDVRSIPRLVVVSRDGKVITTEGLTEVHSSGTQCYKLWSQEVMKTYSLSM